MADIIDVANERATVYLGAALSVRKAEAPPACGACLNCEAPLPEEQRWCDAHCRDDWAQRGKA